mmetsp:Transcript_9308/g.38185  ORF Transcript_9308/g.38185 Transcript_9308/m.38185 type:complete len:173 (+) Transcript_9308:20-538(+)
MVAALGARLERAALHHLRLRRSCCAALLLGATATGFRPPLIKSAVTVRCAASISGLAWDADAEDAPTVSLFTKPGCTLCDDAKAVLAACRAAAPHRLVLVDIDDAEHATWHAAYKYDIPVLHVDDVYWAKHRISEDAALAALRRAAEARRTGDTVAPSPGQPNATRLEVVSR